MSCSLSESRLEVASSRIKIRGSARIARAMEMRWRCPPESFTPRSPTTVSQPVGNGSAKSCTRAEWTAFDAFESHVPWNVVQADLARGRLIFRVLAQYLASAFESR